MAAYLEDVHEVSITRACKVVNLPKSMYYYKSVKDDTAVINKLRELADKKPREGQDKFYDRIRAEGLKWNYKRVRRVYLLLKLNQRRRCKRRVPQRIKEPLQTSERLNQSWSLDFMHDTLTNKRRFRTFNILDDYNRKAISIEAEFSFASTSVITAMQRAIHEHGKPQKVRVDNGPEFISSVFTDWCEKQNIQVQYIQPGKPVQNAYIERFNRTFRQDVLDAYLFEDLMQVRLLAEEWMEDYNNHRPHEALGGMSPKKFEQTFSSAAIADDEKLNQLSLKS